MPPHDKEQSRDLHATAMMHEILRCRDALDAFGDLASLMISGDDSIRTKFRAYNSYAYFLQHLYEFYVACMDREKLLPKSGRERTDRIDEILTEEAQRAIDRRRHAIENGYAPSWENDISYYQVVVPAEFGSDFRKHRNKVASHTTHERISRFSLTEFYAKYHRFLMELYQQTGLAWLSHAEKAWPDLGEVTSFSVAIHKSPPSESPAR